MILLTKERYLDLLNVESEMGLLRAAGVDNWEGFSLEGMEEAEERNQKRAEAEEKRVLTGFVIPSVLEKFGTGIDAIVALSKQDGTFSEPVLLTKEQP